MYSYEDRIRAVELYIRLGKRLSATIRQLERDYSISAHTLH
jgi:putative transposase